MAWAVNRRAPSMGIGITVLGIAIGASMGIAFTSILAPGEGLPKDALRLAAHPAEAPEEQIAFTPEALIARPLFSPNRGVRAKAAPEPTAAPIIARVEEGPAPSYSIGGILLSQSVRKALLRSQPREPGNWVSEGEVTKQGWSVGAIFRDRVVLVRGAREMTVSLHPIRPE